MITKGLTTRDVLAIRVNTGWGCLLRCHFGNLTTYGIRWRVYRSLVFTCCCFFSAELYRFATHLCGPSEDIVPAIISRHHHLTLLTITPLFATSYRGLRNGYCYFNHVKKSGRLID